MSFDSHSIGMINPEGMLCPAPISQTEQILIGHGSGGKLTSELIEGLIVPTLHNPLLAKLDDQACFSLPKAGKLAFTTDSFVVTPLFFPGGDIGELAVNGTVNDLAMGGARPLALSLSLILEEGLRLDTLKRILESVRAAAERVGVPIVTGDTKVVDRGSADQLFINTAGVGLIPEGVELGSARVRAGDAILVSGTMGDHGIAILSRRQNLELQGNLLSDTTPLHTLSDALLSACPNTRAMRDPTRGGLAATLVEIATRQRLGVQVDQAAVPIQDTVSGACELLGLDPFLVANEGKLVAFVPPEDTDTALTALREHPLGRRAACIGTVTDQHPGVVVLRTPLGGQRRLDLPFAEPLPRIC